VNGSAVSSVLISPVVDFLNDCTCCELLQFCETLNQCVSTFGKVVHTLLFNENFILTTNTGVAEE